MTFAVILRGLADTARLMVGVPSYRAYVAHMAEAHPDAPAMDEARYGGRNGGQCC
jgi:uncharacterized short protein YbdD (DUF466 family)